VDILDTCLLYRPARKENADTSPSENKKAKGDWDEPVEREQLVGTAENRMEWRCVDDEHDKSATRNDPDEVVLVANYVFSERKTNFRLDSKDLRKAVGRMSN
jgi:hypothetical protein